MTTEDLISELFYRVDEARTEYPQHPLANLGPSEIVTLGLLFAFERVGTRAFYRWVRRDWRHLFPLLPERTRLFRLLATHRAWTDEFLAAPTILGVVDSYGLELLHPLRAGRRAQQIGRKGKSNHRWIVGGNLCVLLNKLGLVVAWDCAGANAPDPASHPLLETFEDEMIVLGDTAFQTRLAFTSATFNLLVQWHGLMLDVQGFVHLYIGRV